MTETLETKPAPSAETARPQGRLILGVPKEVHSGERRVAVVPRMAAKLAKLGFDVVVESGAGNASAFTDQAYEEAGVQGLLRSHGCDFAWFPAVWPETYSFTLSTAYAAGLYPVAFNLGAIAERIREAGWGALLPFNLVQRPDEIALTLATITIPKASDSQFTPVGVDYADLLRNYYDI